MGRQLPAQLAEIARELPITLSVAEACQVLQMSERTFRRTVAAGRISVVKCGAGSSRVIVTRAEIVRWMSERVTT